MTDPRARRRLLSGAALVGVGLVLALPRAEAQVALPRSWAGTHVTTPSSSTSPDVAITAEWHHAGKVSVTTWLTTPPGLPIGCTDAGESQLTTSTSTDSAQKITTSSASVNIPCNGTYSYRLEGQGLTPILTTETQPLSGSIDIAVTPAPITGVTATADGDSRVALSWSAPSSPPPDFAGYQVQRQGDHGQWTTIATLDPGQHRYTDTSAPTTGGAVSYRVLGRRPGPHGELLSDDSGHASATLPTTTTSSGPSGSTPSTTPGSTPGPGAPGGTKGGSTGTIRTPALTGPLNKGNTGIGVTAPGVGSGTPSFPALPGETDSGSSSTQSQLPYGSTGDGLGAGSESGGLSSAFYQQGSGRGMAVPVATGFVLAAWAFHLRFLARAARPAKVTAPRGQRFS